MSKLGKILLWVALFGAIVAAGAGIALVYAPNGFNEAKANLAQTTAAKVADDQTIVKQKAENAQLAAAKAESDKELADATTKISDLNTQLTTAQQQVKDANTAVETANKNAQTAKAALDAIQTTLGGETPEQYKADKEKAESDLQAALSEQKILQDQMQAYQQQVAYLKDAINRSTHGGQMPGVSGKVTFVDHAWNFVILNVGLSNGVVPNGELIVYRNNTFLGKIKVTKVDPNDSVAEILPDVKGDIQIGDKVLN
jgi:hypothetical protein